MVCISHTGQCVIRLCDLLFCSCVAEFNTLAFNFANMEAGYFYTLHEETTEPIYVHHEEDRVWKSSKSRKLLPTPLFKVFVELLKIPSHVKEGFLGSISRCLQIPKTIRQLLVRRRRTLLHPSLKPIQISELDLDQNGSCPIPSRKSY